MFGLFSRNKAEKQELAELEAQGAAQSTDSFLRRRHANLVHLLHGGLAALPLYESIAADWPSSQRMAFNAASLRLMEGDPAGIPPLEAAARARPSLAVSAYGLLAQYFEATGEEDELRRIQALFADALERRDAAMEEGNFEDPGGPMQAPRYSREDLAFIHARLGRAREVERVFGGARQLDDGAWQQVLLVEAADGADLARAAARTAEVFDLFGEFVLLPLDPKQGWILEQLMQFENSRIYP